MSLWVNVSCKVWMQDKLCNIIIYITHIIILNVIILTSIDYHTLEMKLCFRIWNIYVILIISTFRAFYRGHCNVCATYHGGGKPSYFAAVDKCSIQKSMTQKAILITKPLFRHCMKLNVVHRVNESNNHFTANNSKLTCFDAVWAIPPIDISMECVEHIEYFDLLQCQHNCS